MTLDAVRPYTDELLTSALVRVCRHYLLSMDTLGRHFLGRPKWHPRFIGIPAIAPMAEILGVSASELLWKHTVFPYATAYVDEATYGRAIKSALSDVEPASNGTLAQNAILSIEYWRFCHRCVTEDMARHGESYWRRSHNLPGVWVCSTHHVYLNTTDLSVALASRAPLTLPHEADGKPIRVRRPLPVLTQISQRSALLINRTQGAPPRWSADLYRTIAQESGWLAADAELNAEALSKLISMKCGRAYISNLGLAERVSSHGGWSALMMRPGTKVPFVPLKHVVLTSVLRTPKTDREPGLVHRSKGPSGSDVRQLDRFYGSQAERLLRRVLANGETGLTTDGFLRRIGCAGAYHHRGEALPLLRQVVLRFRASPASVRPLAPGAKLFRNECWPKG